MVGRTFSAFSCLSILLLFLAVTGGCARYGQVILEDERGTVTVEVDKGRGQVATRVDHLEFLPRICHHQVSAESGFQGGRPDNSPRQEIVGNLSDKFHQGHGL
jgi:hypothetical protein